MLLLFFPRYPHVEKQPTPLLCHFACFLHQVESSAKDARAVNIALDLARRLGELRKGYGVPSLSGRRKGRITAVYLAMKEKFAKPLLDILRREYVWSVRVQSGEELLQAISKPLDGFPS